MAVDSVSQDVTVRCEGSNCVSGASAYAYVFASGELTVPDVAASHGGAVTGNDGADSDSDTGTDSGSPLHFNRTKKAETGANANGTVAGADAANIIDDT